MKTNLYSLAFIRRLSLAVVIIVTGLGIQASFSEANASEQQANSITQNNVIQYARCKGQWRYRCSSNDLVAEKSVETYISVNKLDEKAKFHRCGKFWQYHCAGEANALDSGVNFVRQDYRINDQQTFEAKNGNSQKQSYQNSASGFSRCGRYWEFHCGSPR